MSASFISPSNILTPAILSGWPGRSICRNSASPQEKELFPFPFVIAATSSKLPAPPCWSRRLPPKNDPSGQKGESRRQLHQLEHLVNIDIDAAQHDLDGFPVGQPGQLFHRPQRIGIDAAHGREIQDHIAVGTVQRLTGRLQALDYMLSINFKPLAIACHTHDHSSAVCGCDALAIVGRFRPRYALQNSSANSLNSGMRGLDRQEGSSKAILTSSGMARSNSSLEIPSSAMERGIASRSSNRSVAVTRFFTFSSIVLPPRPSRSATIAYFLCAI